MTDAELKNRLRPLVVAFKNTGFEGEDLREAVHTATQELTSGRLKLSQIPELAAVLPQAMRTVREAARKSVQRAQPSPTHSYSDFLQFMAKPTPAKSKQFTDPPPAPKAPGEDLQDMVGDEALRLLSTLTGIASPSPYASQPAIDSAASAIWKRVPDAAKAAVANRIATAADRSPVGWRTLGRAHHSWAEPYGGQLAAPLVKKWGNSVSLLFAADVLETAIVDLCRRAIG